MKNAKKIISISLCILTVSTVMAMSTACGKKDEPIEREPLITEETTESVSIEDPTIETTKKKTKTKTERETTTTKKAVTETKRYESTTSRQTEPTKSNYPSTTKRQEQTTHRRENTTKKPESTTKKQEVTTTKKTEPTTAKKPATTTKPEPVSKPYSCGCKNHHCTTKEEHAFIKSLEEKGCSICGSHSCRSFYVLDEWGQPCYDITKCPKYSEKKDPANYCEHCGKEIGLGDNGTCVRFTVDTKCPICGKKVPAKTCHTH